MEKIIQIAGETLGNLKNVWDEIGCNMDYRRAKLNELAHDVISVYEGYLTQETRYKESLTRQLLEQERAVESVRRDLSEPATQGGATDKPLLLRISRAENELNSLQQKKRARVDELNDMIKDLEDMCSEIDSKVDVRAGDISLQYIEKVRGIWQQVKQEKQSRQSELSNLDKAIADLQVELGEDGYTVDEQGSLSLRRIAALRSRFDKLSEIRAERQAQVESLAQKITPLWDLLNIPQGEREEFVAKHAGFLTATVLAACNAEYRRLISVRDAHIIKEVEKARTHLHGLWEELQSPTEERVVDYKQGESSSEGVSEAEEELKALNKQIALLEAHLIAMRPILTLIQKRESMQKEKVDFDTLASDPNRLLLKKGRRDPGYLLREEQIRKTLTIKLPKLETKLRRSLTDWQDKHDGVPFLYNGIAYLDVMVEQEEVEKKMREEERLKKEREKAQQLEKEMLFGSVQTPKKTPSGSLRGKPTPGGVITPKTTPRTSHENSSFYANTSTMSVVSGSKRKRPPLSPICNTQSPRSLTPSPSPLLMSRSFHVSMMEAASNMHSER